MTELWMWEMQPGEIFTSPGHTEGTLELFYVQTGTLTLGVQDHLYQIETGCSAAARTDVAHFYENRQQVPLVFIMTVQEKAS
jgi:Cupin domain.